MNSTVVRLAMTLLLTLFLLALESVVVKYLGLSVARIDVTVAIVAFLALKAGLLEGALAAYAVGYLLDLMTGQPTGLYTLVALMTFLLGRLAASLVDVRSAISFAGFAMAGDVAHGLLSWAIGGVTGKQLHLAGLAGLPLEVVLTGLAALLLYPLLRRFGLGAERREPGLLGNR